ncbi:MAG: hypothetical protein GEU97_02705 [Actinophytocola sp.]|nr:hypothetical protein [Actinophytocola sp.]
MPSSLIIVALAAAWLIVLVPMVARKRQEVGQTADDALASRVVRRGSARDKREEHLMSESAAHDDRADVDEPVMTDADDVGVAEEHDVAERDDAERDDIDVDDVDGVGQSERDDYGAYDDYSTRLAARRVGYRPGRGGFDPEAAELAARAKYAFRQRVVLALLATVVISAVVAGVVLPLVWWVTGAASTALVGYLVYLRRQVRIETEIRQRRLARLNAARAGWHEEDDLYDPRYDGQYDERGEYDADYDEAEYEDYDTGYRARPSMGERTIPGVERKPRPHSRMRHRNTVVVDIDDEDPAFEQLEQPGSPVYRRAVGE